MTTRPFSAQVVSLLLILSAGGLYGSCQRKAGAAEAKRDAERKADQVLADLSVAWQAQLPAALKAVAADTARAHTAVRAADTLHVKRVALPPPPPAAPDSAKVVYWEKRALLAEAENANLRIAIEAQMQATARLSALLDTTTAQLGAVTAGLGRSIQRESHQGFRVPKIVTEVVGCTAGLLATKGNPLGCAGGAAGLTLITPTQ